MKEIYLGGIGALVLFFLGVALGAISNIGLSSFILKDYIPVLATLVAAFGGAWFAFRLHDKKEKGKEHEANVRAGNIAIFNLLCKINTLLNYKTKVIDPVRKSASIFLGLRSTENHFDPLDLNSLTFLLKNNVNTLLMNLAIGDQQYFIAIEAIIHRSKLYQHEVEPRLEQAGMKDGDEFTKDILKEKLGQRIFSSLDGATNNVVQGVDETIISLQKVVNEFSTSLKRLYPDATIMSLGLCDLNQISKDKK